jgi:hypothetical protein
MRVVKLVDGVLTPTQPIYRAVHRTHSRPGLSFTHPHPINGPVKWRVVMPLGARDFYSEVIPCPTHPTHSTPLICCWCGKPVDADGNCHGVVPAIPPETQEYGLFKLPHQKNEKGCEHILILPEAGVEQPPQLLILWDDNGLGTSVNYEIVAGDAKYIDYGHDSDEVGITVYPVVLVTGQATLRSCADGKYSTYNIDAWMLSDPQMTVRRFD